mmetsp:Transcript_29365/g.40369  ORF Transcript_29365/g.40369 Transcript_29365/m.40369 type:complete len:247 (+) Transcript_29365:264-1004(+)
MYLLLLLLLEVSFEQQGGPVHQLPLQRLQVLVAQLLALLQVRVPHGTAQAAEGLQDGQAAEGHVLLAVAALVGQHQAAPAQLRGRPPQQRGHQAERVAVQHHVGQRVPEGGVQAAARQDQVRPEVAQGRQNHPLEGVLVGAVAAAWRQGQVDGGPLGSRPASLLQQARAHRVVVVLVQRDEQRLAVVPEALLRAVAVVHVEVHDGHSPHRRGRWHGPSIECCDGDVIEYAEPHGFVSLCVVSWRSY